MLRTLCIIIDQETQELYADFKSFKCNGFYNWYESFSVFPWMVPSYDPTYDDLEANNKKIGVYVSTNRDPFVWATYNGTLHFSNLAHSYSVAGIWLITCAFALAVIPLLVYFKEPNSSQIDVSVSNNEVECPDANKDNIQTEQKQFNNKNNISKEMRVLTQ